MAVVMRCLGRPTDGSGPAGEYLEAYDPEAFDGRGDATFTPDLARAKRFATAAEAWAELGRRPVVRPVRGDGKPNRPLTTYTMQILAVEEDPDA
jgi:hypothetical protein